MLFKELNPLQNYWYSEHSLDIACDFGLKTAYFATVT